MPVYDISAAAEALDVPVKHLDNMLSRNVVPGVERKRRGIARRITSDGALAIRLALELVRELHIPASVALGLSRRLLDGGGASRVGNFATLSVNLDELRVSTLARLNAAVETVGRRRRGRPPQRTANRG